jgi:hypothetical protein
MQSGLLRRFAARNDSEGITPPLAPQRSADTAPPDAVPIAALAPRRTSDLSRMSRCDRDESLSRRS